MKINNLKIRCLLLLNSLFISAFSQHEQLNDHYNSKIDSGEVFMQNKDFTKAINMFKNAIVLDSQLRIVRHHLANAYYQRAESSKYAKDYNNAVKDYDSAIIYGFVPSSYFYLNRAEMRLKSKDLEGALIDYNLAIELSPDASDLYGKRGELKHNLKDFDGAIADFTKEIELNPEYWIPFSNRGFTERMIGKYQDAIEDYTKAIELYTDPPYLPYYGCRADAYFKNGDYQKAVDDYTFIIDFDSYSIYYEEIFIKLGKAQLMLKEYKAALKSFNEQINLRPYDGIGYYERALLNIELGHTKKVCKDLKMAQELNYEFDISIISRYCN